uniref:Uncharacterized protein n=1 Tax=Anguilla anguilla TaxID=7936 RepID=A0A0E9W375_ANGAN
MHSIHAVIGCVMCLVIQLPVMFYFEIML